MYSLKQHLPYHPGVGSCNTEYMFTQRIVLMRRTQKSGMHIVAALYTHGYDIHCVVAVHTCTQFLDSDLIVMRNDDINQTMIRDHCTSRACQ